MDLSHKEKIRLTGIKKFGSELAWRAHLSENGIKGGQVKVPKGFATMDKRKQKEASRKGGQNRGQET